MRKYKVLFLLFIISILFVACEKKSDDSFAKMHWDRDSCERCVMVISEKGYAVQVENPITKQKYKFDDIGCAVLWFKETKKDWFEIANIWVKDEKSKNWIDARSALWSSGHISPMNYGLAAYNNENFPKHSTYFQMPSSHLQETR